MKKDWQKEEMKTSNKNFYFSVAILVGTIVGVGIFGIPYAMAQSGFFIGLVYFFILGGAILILHLMYGEVVSRTKEKHRLVGYTKKYLSPFWQIVVFFSVIFIILGALLAYIIITGEFLESLFGFNSFWWSLIFWFLLSLGIWRGIKAISFLEFLMAIFLFVVILVIFIIGVPNISFANLITFSPQYIFLPYGIILFAMAGIQAIPEMRAIINIDGKQYKKAIIAGTLIPLILYFLFALVVIGITGSSTSQEAISGLINSLGSSLVFLGAVFGVLAAATSFLILGINLRHTLEYDFKIKKNLAVFLVCISPLIIFLLGVQNFIEVVSVTGSIGTGIGGIVLILLYKKAKIKGEKEAEYNLNFPSPVIYGLAAIFILGIIYQIIYLF